MAQCLSWQRSATRCYSGRSSPPNGRTSRLATALGNDVKGKLSLVAYFVAVPFAFLNPWIGVALYIAVTILWFVPDRRIETAA